MKLEEIKTENDAREALIEQILTLNLFIGADMRFAKSSFMDEIILFKRLREYAQERFDIDATPYDNVARKYANNI